MMVWVAFSRHAVGPIYKINTQMDQYVFKKILTDTVILFAEENIPLILKLIYANDPRP